MMIKRTIKLAGITLIMFLTGAIHLFAQSIAHERSSFSVIDPTYRINKNLPPSNIKIQSPTWIYGPAELECYRLQMLIQRKDSAKLKVGYPGVFHLPYRTASFRLKLNGHVMINSIKFRAVGHGKIFLNHEYLAEFNENDSFKSISLAAKIDLKEIQFEIISCNDLPALLIEDEIISTSNNAWDWKTETENWQSAFHFPQNLSEVPPHRLEDPTVILQPVSVENRLYDFGRELLGYIMVRNTQQPKIFVGESKSEALDTRSNVLEQSLEMVQTKNGFWISKSPLAFRYLHVVNNQEDTVQCKAIFYPLTYKGAFACSDSTLTRIWMSSAYTLRLCLHDFMLDGIKRDRLPWTGDLAMSMVCNAYTFNEPELVRRSLVALGRAGIKEKDINGIIDYSLWWVIAQDQYQLYFGDSPYLKSEWGRIKETINLLSARCDSSGFLIPQNSWLFIDWVNQDKWTALQILWWWAQESGARLAHRVNDFETENQLKSKSEDLKNTLLKNVWSERKQFWLTNIDSLSERTRHPNFLAVVSGLAPHGQFVGIKKMLEDDDVKPVGTPYMAGFENIALARLGNIQLMLDRVRRCWGGMLRQGATTFWEAYDTKQSGDGQYEFYNRPYGKSLCHAWSAGPAAFLPSEILGLRPLDDGWKRFSVNPNMGDLEWVTGTVPTRYGDIKVDIEKDIITISVPEGTTLLWKGKSIVGPYLVKDQR